MRVPNCDRFSAIYLQRGMHLFAALPRMLSSLIDMARSRLAGRSCTIPTMMENMNAASRARDRRRFFLPLEKQWTYLGNLSKYLGNVSKYPSILTPELEGGE